MCIDKRKKGRSPLVDDLRERCTSSGGSELQRDEVDGAGGLHEDFREELATINGVIRVVATVANNEVVNNASA